MTTRDRTIFFVAGVLAVIGAFWFLAIKPRRAELKTLNGQVATAQQQHDTAVQNVAAAHAAERGYSRDRAVVARLGKAVPTDDDTASLIYQIDSAAGLYKVDFHSFQLGAGSAASTAAPAAASQSATAALPPGAVVGSAGLSKLPFSVSFNGDYFGLEDFLRRMHAFTAVRGQAISVHGRLLAVDGISLTPGPGGFPSITANLTASAFLAPPADASASTAPAAGAQPAAAAAASPAPTTAAVITGVGR